MNSFKLKKKLQYLFVTQFEKYLPVDQNRFDYRF